MAAVKQLCLSDIIETSDPYEREPNMVDALLDHHRGDYRLVIEELLADADFLRDQLFVASQVVSRGYSRGWKPRYERL